MKMKMLIKLFLFCYDFLLAFVLSHTITPLYATIVSSVHTIGIPSSHRQIELTSWQNVYKIIFISRYGMLPTLPKHIERVKLVPACFASSHGHASFLRFRERCLDIWIGRSEKWGVEAKLCGNNFWY